MDVFILCAAKYDYNSINGKSWDKGVQWLADGVKRKHKGTSPLHRKIAASAKPEMKSDSFKKMSISPRRVEELKYLGKAYFMPRRPIFHIVKTHETSRAPLAL